MSKACNLKSNQKVFYLQINQVASCSCARGSTIAPSDNIDLYIDRWNQEKQQLTDGIELADCQYCWKDERQGKISFRQKAEFTDTNLIELYISNLCNHMCSYCSPKYSSIWEESIKTHGIFQNISSTAKNNLIKTHSVADIDRWITQIENYIHTCDDNSVSLKLLGGEPLMQQRNLEKLLSFNSNKIKRLSVHTNLNPPTNKFLIWLLDNIDINKLNVIISLDASADYNHIPRAGFNKDRFSQNLELLTNNNIDFSFNAIISVLSVFDLENFITWGNNNNFKIAFNKLNNPDCLDPIYIPLKFREQIWKKISQLSIDPVIAEIFQQQNDINDLKLIEQYNYLTQYFNRTDIVVNQIDNDIFCEYWSWLTNFVDRKIK